MFCRSIRYCLVPATLVALSSTHAGAANPTYYDDQLTFKAEVTNTVTDDYSNPDYSEIVMSNAVMNAVLGETDYTTTGFSDNNRVLLGAYCAGCNGSFELAFQTTTVGTATGVHGVGLTVIENDPMFAFIAYITFADGTTENVLMPEPGEFWGVIALERIERIHFGQSGGAPTQNGDFRIDDLIVGDQVLAYESCDGEPLDLSTLTPGSGETVTQVGSTLGATDDIAETDEVACWNSSDAPEHIYAFTLDSQRSLQIDLDGSSYDTKLAIVAGCPDGDSFCEYNDDYGALTSGFDCMLYPEGSYSAIVSGAGVAGDYSLNLTECGPPCGDAMLGDGEICDDGGKSATCDEDCTEVECGDGTINATAGEACDDGNTADGDGCSAACVNESGDTSGGSGPADTSGDDGATATTLDGSGSDGATLSAGSLDGGDDTGAGSSSSGDAGQLDDGGCGCAADGRRAPWFASLLMFGALRRRRRALAS